MFKVSHSQLNLYRICPRRWWFKYVANLEEPETPQMALGKAVGEEIDVYYKSSGKRLCALAQSRVATSWLDGQYPMDQIRTEVSGDLQGDGFIYTGKADVIIETPTEFIIYDWKTGKKRDVDVTKDPQLVGYANIFWSGIKSLKLGLIYLQNTKLIPIESGDCGPMLDRTYTISIRSSVSEIRTLSTNSDVESTPVKLSGCRAFNRDCPYLSHCSQRQSAPW